MTSMKHALSLALVTACSWQAAYASTDRKGPSKTRSMTCYLKVDGVVRINNRCDVYPMGDGGYTLNSWDRGKPRPSHFAVVSVAADGIADATWNADPNDDRATSPLGRMTMKHGCWVNARARICASQSHRKN